ncbi:hypothetical protein E2C00_08735 [Streptomyces sp. WAC05374]|uniref:winged helix DNA-binding protein n=1 Tax=Streptomyces sp. WAC05374 TaxID=2487420 RepID=UPI000F8900C3|nr:winged helix DNA-binding protein [Streptomyces sp. WAC05374]RST13543.1 hypothetical protein EF905_20115 [Streptomyces sp. WAC05374]TDF47616.1 hypothetical protein E2C02_29805 [Streptomyces sp. WAC05374]TDF48624.1 hypothetical protein E2B92_07125 [Streptomyces sp. WAC05374]TDF59126.1 hypothetical protein E2C00_08735 [Streptomyces sp. WAC05374]
MIVLVPVSMFRVSYQVAQGRPYSRLERRVLEAIAAGEGVTLTSLCDTFRVHERLMVEAVVTLVGAGWVAVTNGREATFVLTDEGQKACTSGQDPASVTVLAASPCTVIFDRTTGQLARRGEVPTVVEKEARLDLNPCTPERILRTSLDESQIQKLLPRPSGAWVRSIDRPRLVTFRRYVAVRVDLAEQSLVGLPRGWHQALAPEIFAVAAQRQEEDEGGVTFEHVAEKSPVAVVATGRGVTATAEQAPGAPGTPPSPVASASPVAPRAGATAGAPRITPLLIAQRGGPSPGSAARPSPSAAIPAFPWLDEERPEWAEDTYPPLSSEAVLFSAVSGAKEHDHLLLEALSTARRHVLISSPVVTRDGLDRMSEAVHGAVARGVRVDVLHGAADGDPTTEGVVNLLNKLGYEAARGKGRDLLKPVRRPTGSGAGLLLFDRDGGALEGVVGDHAWCGSPAADVSRSVHLGGSEFMAQLARAAAGLWAWSGDPDSADRWRRVAIRCQDATAIASARGNGAKDQVPVELIVDDEHTGMVNARSDEEYAYFGAAHRHDDGLTVGVRGLTVVLRRADTYPAPA